ncbi:orotidine-5'-phosphate decarboxylase [soil metagenome]
MPSFGERLDAAFDGFGHVCLGIDAHAHLLAEWGLPDSAEGARIFGLRAVEAAAGVVGIVKPQIAFFERHGSACYAALEEVLAAARSAGLLIIADVKRGDIGSTIDAYGEAWLTPGSPLEVDAMTLVAYQGVGSISGPIALARANGKGVFVLAATSNIEAYPLQSAVLQTGAHFRLTVAAGIVAEVDAINDGGSLGSVGVVLGATVGFADYGIDPGLLASTPILAPGFGEQGAVLSRMPELYGPAAANVIANLGRSVLKAGPADIRATLEAQVDELSRALDV